MCNAYDGFNLLSGPLLGISIFCGKPQTNQQGFWKSTSTLCASHIHFSCSCESSRNHNLQLAVIPIRPPSQLPECYFTFGYHLFIIHCVLDDDHCGYILFSIHSSRLVEVSYLFCRFPGTMGVCYMDIMDSWNRPR